MYVGQGRKNKQWLVYKTHNDLYTSCTLYLYTSHTACVRCLCIPCNVYSMAMYTIRGNWTRRLGRENILMHNYSIFCREYVFPTFIHRKYMQHYSISLVMSSVWVDIKAKGTKKGTSKIKTTCKYRNDCTRVKAKLWQTGVWPVIYNLVIYVQVGNIQYNLVIYKLRLMQLVQWSHSHYNHQHHHCLSKVLSLFDYSRCYVVKTKRSFYPLSW